MKRVLIRRVLIFSGLALSGVVVVAMFVTATSYVQLIVAMVAYPALVYFAFKALPRGVASRVSRQMTGALKPLEELKKLDVADIDKRGFLKLIGAAGLSFFLFSLLNKRGEVPFLGGLTGARADNGRDPTESYRISEVSEGLITYYGFIKQGGAWFIMQEDTETGSFRYVKGSSNFPQNWTDRERLRYDYYDNVF